MKLRNLVSLAAVLAGCQTPDTTVTTPKTPAAPAVVAEIPHHASVVQKAADQLSGEQLAQVRRATSRYHDYRNALADNYQENIVLPNMGKHFLKDSLVDARFDAEHPELLVYAPVDGRLVLVAVEYAVPQSLTATAPEGFEGDADEWTLFAPTPDPDVKLWTLHAWIWRHNPDGMFNPTNKEVP
jgi:hypothetical protein